MTGPVPAAPTDRVPGGAGRPVHRVGLRALLADCADGAEARGLRAALQAEPLPGQGEVLTGARTVLVRFADAGAATDVAATLATLPAAPVGRTTGPQVVLDTVYDGADLDDVADALGLSREALVRAHTERRWTAAFVGFAPGFAYLEPDGPAWDVPRRPTPRTAVPAGSVAVAGPYAAVYPRASPGGWQLLGRTDAVLWDLSRDVAALVTAGTRVRFRAVRATVAAGSGVGAGRPADAGAPADARSGAATGAPADGGAPPTGLEVVAPGLLSLVEDLGRPGHLDLGVSPSGALDRGAAVAANRLVGNPRGAAVVETVLGGLVLRARGVQVLAVTGAAVGLTREGAGGDVLGHPITGLPFALRDGERLVVDAPSTGLRAYVAVRGGLAVPPVLGSRSTDLLSGLGPDPLRAGDVLGVLPPPADAVAGWPDPPVEPTTGPAVVRLLPGPRADRLTDAAVRRLGTQTWTVAAESNRVGLRLTGEPLERSRSEELPSEGVVAGSVQVPPSGLPVVFLADHPVTGGYPVVGVVHEGDLDRLAQVRPGDGVRFTVCSGDAPTSGARPAR